MGNWIDKKLVINIIYRNDSFKKLKCKRGTIPVFYLLYCFM